MYLTHSNNTTNTNSWVAVAANVGDERRAQTWNFGPFILDTNISILLGSECEHIICARQ